MAKGATAEELKAQFAAVAKERKGGRRCMTGEFLEKMTPEQREAFEDALTQSYPITALVEVLKSWGFVTNVGNVGRHRKGDCACATQD